jgi:hypothetical protein
VHRIEHVVLGSVGRAIVVELQSEVLHELGLVEMLCAVVVLVALVALKVLQVLAVLGKQLPRVD